MLLQFIRKEMETKNCAVYVVPGYDADGRKDVPGLWTGESEGKHYWMQIFDEIRAGGVEDVPFISMDRVSGLEERARSIFQDVVVQRCIVHLIRNSIKYIPSKDYKAYTAQLKKVYGAPSLKAAEAEFERLKQAWSKYPGAIDVWIRSWQHVARLYNYGSTVRKVMYTTNAIESVNSSLSINCLNFPLFSRLYGMPSLKICIRFLCFCPYQQVTGESFSYSVFIA